LRLRVAVCDDEKIFTDAVCGLIEQQKPEYQVQTFSSGAKLLEDSRHFDLIFLDIDMPDISGIQVAKEIRRRDEGSYVVFLTSHSDFYEQAFRVQVYRYLRKPIQKESFLEATFAIEEEIQKRGVLSVKTADGDYGIPARRILYVEAANRHVYIHTKDEVLETNFRLSDMEQVLLPYDFIKINKSVLVSLYYVRKVGYEYLLLENGEELDVSRRKMAVVREQFRQYVKAHAYRYE